MVLEPSPPQLLVISPHALRSWKDRPRRFLDPLPLPQSGTAAVSAWFDSDEDLVRLYFGRRQGRAETLIKCLRLLFQHRSQLRKASLIYCLDAASFATLIFLSRLGWIDCRGKAIRRYCFHDSTVEKLVPLVKRSHQAFQIEVITHQQLARANSLLGSERVVLREWKIDAEWYHPAHRPETKRLLLPGNASRDDSMVDSLLERGFPITRAGREHSLQKRFSAYQGRAGFSLSTNSSHLEYRDLLQNSSTVLLPILPCDDPAGLTAALEAILCRVPLLANRSMGLSELFQDCAYPVPMLDNLDADKWAQAASWLDQRRHSDEFKSALEASRQRIIQNRAILPDGGDWSRMLDEVISRPEFKKSA